MKTPISYYGGKQTLLKHILPLIPDHKLYTEAFCGGCAVLFAKASAECEATRSTPTHAISMSTLLTSPRSSGHGPFGSAPSSASPR